MRNLDSCHRHAWPKDKSGRGRALIVPKKTYRTADEAATAAALRGQRPYHCPRCGQFHLTRGAA